MKQIIFTAILIFAFCFAVFAQSNENLCPNLNVSSFEYQNNIQVFTVEAVKEIGNYNVKYKWTAKAGNIIAGNDTKTVVFLREGNQYSVTVEVKGLPKNCDRSETQSGVFDPPESVMIAQFGKIPSGETKAIMDAFLIELHNDPTAEGLIVISDNKNSINQLKSLNNYIALREFDKTRISFLITNELRDKTRLFIIPAGANNPTYENNLIIETEEVDKLESFFRPKPITKKRKK